MNDLGILFAVVMASLLLLLPRRLAFAPLLIGAAYITAVQVVEVGPFHFPVIRLLICAGMVRVITRKEMLSGGVNILDKVMVLWAVWTIASAAFHKSGVFVYRLGVVYDFLGIYLLFRVFIEGWEGVRNVFKVVSILLLPLAVLMILERVTGKNPLALVGFGPTQPEFRNGYYRAQGAFAHPILAGTVGAVCLPMALSLWWRNRRVALVGLAATSSMVFTCGSSGPLMTSFSVLAAMALWRIRDHLRGIRWAALLLLLVLNAVMKAPVYYLAMRIDITGGSMGYYRARLIESAFEHLNEWWLTGTDYTRHWMASGISANPDHVDMTNQYLVMGVWGGLLLIGLFLAILAVAFSRIGRVSRLSPQGSLEEQFTAWTLGSVLFGHTVAFFSISYFDQTFAFLQLAVASIGSLQIASQTNSLTAAQSQAWRSPEGDPSHCPTL